MNNHDELSSHKGSDNMSEHNDLKDTEQKAFQDTMRDGLTEIFAGFLFFLAPIMAYESSFMIYFAMFYVIFLPPGLENIRQKYTYPRIGYVKMRVEKIKLDLKSLLIFLVILISGTLTAIILMTDDISNIYNWVTILPFTLGLVMLGPSSFLVEKTGMKKYWLFGIITSVFGLLVTYFTILNPPASPYFGVLGFSMMLGAGLLVVGIITLLRFIYNNPVIATQEDAENE